MPGISRPLLFPLRAWRHVWRLARDPVHRHTMRLFWWPPENAFQPFNDTQADRYPRIFKFVQERLGADRPLDIMSYGCATGEEVFTLRRYFPHAAIKGLDINRANIAVALEGLRSSPDPAISFQCSGSMEREPPEVYDAIFCMAVLRHGSLGEPGVTRCDHLIRFSTFERFIADFHRCLKPGGLLVVRHSNFRVTDTGSAFKTVLSVPMTGTKKTPIFGPDNTLLPGIEYPDTVFQKTQSQSI